MSKSRLTKEECQEKYYEMSKNLGKASEEFCKDIDSMQMWFEALSFELGYLDGLACLFGQPREGRIRAKNDFYAMGKQYCLDGHNKLCKAENCEAAEWLEVELKGN